MLRASSGSARYQTPQSTVPTWGLVNPVAGVHSGATIWVNFSNLNRTNTLRKPLIVVEGYDVSTVAPNLQWNYWIGDFIQAISTEPGNTYDFNGALDDVAGYDLVFIDFNDGADDIVRNAAIVQEVINRVNANKVNDNRFGNIRQQNVVMGLSMGGLCARYALANMTKNFPGTPTETRLLITHDSPHRGANVPLGLQYMIRMMGEVQLFGTGIRDIFPDYDDAIGLLNAPATQQQLLYRATTANNFANNVFLDATYRPMITFSPSDPQPTYRFIATANGNECANPLFNPGRTFINLGAGVSAGIYGRLLFFRVPILTYRLAAEVEAYALPNSGSTNKIARVYTINNLRLFGFINIFRELYNNTAFAPGNHLAVDGVPGSTSPLLDVEALNEITNLPIFAASLYVSFPLGPFLGGYFGIYAYNAGVSINFTFVPVGSALDVSPYNNNVFSQKYVNGTNQNFPSSSETFIAQETVQNNPLVSNNVHIRFTARNCQWLYNEMENLNNNLNCSNECSNPYYVGGRTTLCTSETYFVPGLQRGATVTWSASPSGIVNLSCTTCTSTTLTKVSNGIVTLTATLNGACGGGTIQLQKTIQVGTPVVSWPEVVYPITSSGCLPMGFNVSYQSFIDPQMPNGSLIWGYFEGATGGNLNIVNTGAGSGTYQPIRIQNTQQYNRIYVAGENECGVGTPAIRIFEFSSNCDGGPDVEYRSSQTPVVGVKSKFTTVNIFPNPATNRFSITLPDNLIGGQLIILSLQGKIMKSEKVVTNNFNVEATNLASGVYIVEIKNKGNSFRQKILIAR
ncbi:MAG: T9SS type A sorting domain-containing protein [Chitinophagaceae bacterium]